MLPPSKRFPTLILASGAVVLVVAIAIGEHMGNRVIGEATERTLQSVAPIVVTPAPDRTTGPYGPEWERSEALSAAADPGFPDPRIPPKALPTAPAPPTPTPTPAPATPTPNPNIPIWRQQPLPTPSPAQTPTEGASGSPSPLSAEQGAEPSVNPP